jgi:hypothetical protein
MQSAYPRLRIAIFLLSIGLALIAPAPYANAQLKPGTCFDYRGTLGQATKIGMSLYAQDQQLKGSYFYKTHLEDILLTGRYTAARDISLTEKGKGGEIRGTFVMHFAENDPQFKTSEPLQAEVLVGKWISADGGLSYPVHLKMVQNCPLPRQTRYAVAGARNDEAVEKNVQAFYNAIAAGNPEEAARYVSFPCSYFVSGKRKMIQNSAEFLKLYAQIFVPKYVSGIAKGTPHNMFANDQGIMLADGRVWFDADGKAVHLNNEPPAR